MAYNIKGVPFANIYEPGSSTNITTINNNSFKGLGAWSKYYLAIEKPFPTKSYFVSNTDIGASLNAITSKYTSPSTIYTYNNPSHSFYKHANFMIIGGGGGGGAGGGGSKQDSNGNSGNPGGYGGHGRFKVVAAYPLANITSLSITVGAGGAGGSGVKKDTGMNGVNGGISKVEFTPPSPSDAFNITYFTAEGGGGGTGGAFASTPTAPSPSQQGTTPIANYNFIQFTLYDSTDTAPLVFTSPVPGNILVNDVTNMYARDTDSPLSAIRNSGLGGSAGSGNNNPGSTFPGAAASFGQNGSNGNGGCIVIYWLYDP